MALDGEVGELEALNVEGLMVGAAYAGFDLLGTRMALLVEQNIRERDELFVPLRNNILIVFGVIALLVALIGTAFAYAIAASLKRVGAAMARVANRDYESLIEDIGRKGEVGAIAVALDGFRNKLIEAEAKELEAIIKSVAFEEASTAMMAVDRDLNITYVNETTKTLFSENIEHFRADFPSFDLEQLVGTNIDVFHKNPAHQRKILADLSKMPFGTDINVGGLKMSLSASAIMDTKGRHIGSLLEWANVTEIRLNSGIIHAINQHQATAEYSLDGGILKVNDTFAGIYGYRPEELVGKPHDVLVEHFE